MVNIKRAAYLSLAAYALSFVTGLAAASFLGIEMDFDETPMAVWIVGIVATIIISALFSFWYFKDETIAPNPREGMLFSLVLFVVSFMLDLVFVVPYVIATGQTADILDYYTDPFFWIIVLAMFLTCMYVGYYLAHKPKKRELIAETLEEKAKAKKVKMSLKKSKTRKKPKKK